MPRRGPPREARGLPFHAALLLALFCRSSSASRGPYLTSTRGGGGPAAEQQNNQSQPALAGLAPGRTFVPAVRGLTESGPSVERPAGTGNIVRAMTTSRGLPLLLRVPAAAAMQRGEQQPRGEKKVPLVVYLHTVHEAQDAARSVGKGDLRSKPDPWLVRLLRYASFNGNAK